MVAPTPPTKGGIGKKLRRERQKTALGGDEWEVENVNRICTETGRCSVPGLRGTQGGHGRSVK